MDITPSPVRAKRSDWHTPTGDIPVLSITNGRSRVVIGNSDLEHVAAVLIDVITARDALQDREVTA